MLTSCIGNQTFFTIFYEQNQLLDNVKNILTDDNMKMIDNFDYDSYMRRIVENIDMPFYKPAQLEGVPQDFEEFDEDEDSNACESSDND